MILNRESTNAVDNMQASSATELLTSQLAKYFTFLLGKLRDPEAADEILQQVTLKVLERSSQLRSQVRAEA